jgi:hypothetical protein
VKSVKKSSEQWLFDIPNQRLRADCSVVVCAMAMLSEYRLSTSRIDRVGEKEREDLQRLGPVEEGRKERGE